MTNETHKIVNDFFNYGHLFPTFETDQHENNLTANSEYCVPFNVQKAVKDDLIFYRIDLPGFTHEEIDVYEMPDSFNLKASHKDEIFGQRIFVEHNIAKPKNSEIQRCLFRNGILEITFKKNDQIKHKVEIN